MATYNSKNEDFVKGRYVPEDSALKKGSFFSTLAQNPKKDSGI